jgi:large subunit ribosomal protein L15e
MAKGMYHYLREMWRAPSKELTHSRMIQWRAGDAIARVDKPLRLDRARALGYKAKRGILVFRVRIIRGGRKRPRHTHGRVSRKQHERKILKMSYQWVAEQRVSKRYPSLEVLNSYLLGKDGKHYFFEVIAVDISKPEIANDSNFAWLLRGENRRRAERGLTSAAKKSRGLKTKSPFIKTRPSVRAFARTGK